MTTANCPVHGAQQATMVCQHIAAGLVSRERVGFWWSSSLCSSRPDAWCAACNERLNAAGDWVGEALELANPQTLCGACYDVAKVFHMGGDPWV